MLDPISSEWGISTHNCNNSLKSSHVTFTNFPNFYFVNSLSNLLTLNRVSSLFILHRFLSEVHIPPNTLTHFSHWSKVSQTDSCSRFFYSGSKSYLSSSIFVLSIKGVTLSNKWFTTITFSTEKKRRWKNFVFKQKTKKKEPYYDLPQDLLYLLES